MKKLKRLKKNWTSFNITIICFLAFGFSSRNGKGLITFGFQLVTEGFPSPRPLPQTGILWKLPNKKISNSFVVIKFFMLVFAKFLVFYFPNTFTLLFQQFIHFFFYDQFDLFLQSTILARSVCLLSNIVIMRKKKLFSYFTALEHSIFFVIGVFS